MAQYDVFSNPVKSERERYPYVVDMQHDLYDQMQTRWVMPLARTPFAKNMPQNLCPVIFVEGLSLFAVPTMTAPFFAKALGKKVASVSAQASALIGAIDAVMSAY